MSVVDRVMVYLQVCVSGARIPPRAVALVDPEGSVGGALFFEQAVPNSVRIVALGPDAL
ncbi:hypothetical protein [Halochromatium roseum]|uniref:hypothetical protein n=1 Tax=Halochromatium roseum TaxID=391920 RepID=UPI0019149710|nr:hypothetical protein [Halochromatium roseum]